MNHPYSFFRDLLPITTLALCSAFSATGAEAILPAPVSLAADITKATNARQPLVVMVSLEGCAFCKIVRDSHLGPMRERDGLPVVQVDMRSKQVLTDAKGQKVTHDELVRSWGIKVAPTVLFLGRDGAEIAPRMVGGYIPDFYGTYLEENLITARKLLPSQR